jgi:hypothetical protein
MVTVKYEVAEWLAKQNNPNATPHEVYLLWWHLLEWVPRSEEELIDLLNRLPPNLREKVWSWPYTEYPEYRSYSLKRVNTPPP